MLTDLDTGRSKNILKTLLAISLILIGIWSNSIYAKNKKYFWFCFYCF